MRICLEKYFDVLCIKFNIKQVTTLGYSIKNHTPLTVEDFGKVCYRQNVNFQMHQPSVYIFRLGSSQRE